jgi:hypothetical protein
VLYSPLFFFSFSFVPMEDRVGGPGKYLYKKGDSGSSSSSSGSLPGPAARLWVWVWVPLQFLPHPPSIVAFTSAVSQSKAGLGPREKPRAFWVWVPYFFLSLLPKFLRRCWQWYGIRYGGLKTENQRHEIAGAIWCIYGLTVHKANCFPL